MRNALPTYEGQTVQTKGAPDQFNRTQADPDAFGFASGRALAQFGSQFQKTGEELTRAAYIRSEQDKADAALATTTDVTKKTQEYLYGGVGPDGKFTPGYLARKGTEAANGVQDWTQYGATLREQALAGLDDPRQKAIVGQQLDRILLAQTDNVARHQQTQQEAVTSATGNAAVTTAANMLVTGYNDEKVRGVAEEQMAQAIRSVNVGMPVEAVQAKIDEARSKAYQNVVMRSLANGNAAEADALYNQLKSQNKFIGTDMLELEARLKPGLRQYEADNLATQIIGQTGTPAATVQTAIGGTPPLPTFARPGAPGQPPAPGTPQVPTLARPGITAVQLAPAVAQVESSGNPAAVSSAGAGGIMQLMPGTAREIDKRVGAGVFDGMSDAQITAFITSSKGAGIGAAYGTIHLDELLTKYNGRLAPTLIAYNAGPGVADKWIKAGGDMSVLPDETRKYIPKVMSRLADSQGNVGPWGDGRGGQSTLDGMPTLPPPGQKLDREGIRILPNAFYTANDVLPPGVAGGVDARFMLMANELGKRFFAATGVKVPINDHYEEGQSVTSSGRRRGFASADDNPHVSKSQHLEGNAADFQIQGLNDQQKLQFAELARQVGFTGYGFYGEGGHLHLDIGRPRSWIGTGGMPEWAKGINFNGYASGGRPGEYQGENGSLPLPPSMMAAVQGQDPRRAQGPYSGIASLVSMPVTTPLPFSMVETLGDKPDQSPVPAAPGVVPAPEDPMSATINLGARDYAAMRARVAQIPDPEQRRMVDARIDQYINDNERARKELVSSVTNQITRHVLNGGKLADVDQNLLAQLYVNAPDTLSRLEAREAASQAKLDAAAAKAAKPVDTTDWSVYTQLSRMSDAELATVDLTQYADKLKDEHLKQFTDRQAQSFRVVKDPNGGDTRKDEDLLKFRLASLPGIGDAKPNDTAAAAREGMLRNAYEKMVRERRADLPVGRDVSIEDKQKILDHLTQSVNKADYTGGSKYLFEMGYDDENRRKRAEGLPVVGDMEQLSPAAEPKDVPETAYPTLVSMVRFTNPKMAAVSKDDLVPLYNEMITASTGRAPDPKSLVGTAFKSWYVERYKGNTVRLSQVNEAYRRYLTEDLPAQMAPR